MTDKESIPGTQAVTRALALLKSFSDQEPELSLTELASRAQLNKTTAYRLLSALEKESMIVRDGRSETYRLGPEVIALGGRALRANDLRSVSHPCLEELAERTGETATLEILTGNQVLILDEVTSSYLIGTSHSIGTRWPAHATSTGKILLAFQPEEQLQKVITAPLEKLTKNTLNDVALLKRAFNRIRDQGYAIAVEEIEVGYIAVGAPIRDHDGKVIAAISVGGPSTRMTEQKLPALIDQVVETAASISNSLGYRPTK
jgi:DNA-binding IclR family transcriptional regulator